MEKKLSDLKQQVRANLDRLAQTAAAGEAGPSNQQQGRWWENAYANHPGNPFGYREEDAPANSEDEGPGGENPTLRPGEQVGGSDDDDGIDDEDTSSNSMNGFVVDEEDVAEEQRAAKRAVEKEEEWELGKGRKGSKRAQGVKKGKKKQLQRLQRAGQGGGGDGDGGGDGSDDGRGGDGLEDDVGGDGEEEEEGDAEVLIASEQDELSLRAFAGNGKEEDVLPCYLEYLLRAALDPDWAQVGMGWVGMGKRGLGMGCRMGWGWT